jgi:hypothetical protein
MACSCKKCARSEVEKEATGLIVETYPNRLRTSQSDRPKPTNLSKI